MLGSSLSYSGHVANNDLALPAHERALTHALLSASDRRGPGKRARDILQSSSGVGGEDEARPPRVKNTRPKDRARELMPATKKLQTMHGHFWEIQDSHDGVPDPLRRLIQIKHAPSGEMQLISGRNVKS